jgi:hypothetical protein
VDEDTLGAHCDTVEPYRYPERFSSVRVAHATKGAQRERPSDQRSSHLACQVRRRGDAGSHADALLFLQGSEVSD